jgi:hypothetical protein
MKPAVRPSVVCGLFALGLMVWMVSRSGSHIRDTPFTGQFNQVSRLTGKLVLSQITPPEGPDSKRIEAFEAAGILSSNDVAYVREHGIRFHGFDRTRTGAHVVIFETVWRSTSPPRRIIGYGDGHAEACVLPQEP